MQILSSFSSGHKKKSHWHYQKHTWPCMLLPLEASFLEAGPGESLSTYVSETTMTPFHSGLLSYSNIYSHNLEGYCSFCLDNEGLQCFKEEGSEGVCPHTQGKQQKLFPANVFHQLVAKNSCITWLTFTSTAAKLRHVLVQRTSLETRRSLIPPW